MNRYRYIARDSSLKTVDGFLYSHSTRSAVKELIACGLTPINLVVEHKASSLREALDRMLYPRLLFLTLFTSSLSKLIQSGLTLPQSLKILTNQNSGNRFIKSKLEKTLREIECGSALSDAISSSSDLFPDYLIAAIRAGEECGQLTDVLNRSSDFFSRLRKLRDKFLTSMAYPSLLLLLSIATLIVLFAVVIPELATMYDELGAEMPWQSQVLIEVSNTLSENLLLVILSVLGILSALTWQIVVSRKTGGVTSSVARLPIVRRFLSLAELTDFLGILGILLSSGVSLPKGLSTASSVISDQKNRGQVDTMAECIESGESFSAALPRFAILPDYVRDILSIGDEANCLPESLEHASGIVRSDLEERIKIFTALLEPSMVVIVAGIVAFVVYSVLLPLVSLDFLVS